jgi:hypothetical protein
MESTDNDRAMTAMPRIVLRIATCSLPAHGPSDEADPDLSLYPRSANLEPVAALGLAWLWFGQVLSPLQGAGALLILGAVALLHDPGSMKVAVAET